MVAHGKDKVAPGQIPGPESSGKRCRPNDEMEHSTLLFAAAKRHHSPGVPQFSVAAVRASEEREDGEDHESKEDLDAGGVGTSETKMYASGCNMPYLEGFQSLTSFAARTL